MVNFLYSDLNELFFSFNSSQFAWHEKLSIRKLLCVDFNLFTSDVMKIKLILTINIILMKEN